MGKDSVVEQVWVDHVLVIGSKKELEKFEKYTRKGVGEPQILIYKDEKPQIIARSKKAGEFILVYSYASSSEDYFPPLDYFEVFHQQEPNVRVELHRFCHVADEHTFIKRQRSDGFAVETKELMY